MSGRTIGLILGTLVVLGWFAVIILAILYPHGIS